MSCRRRSCLVLSIRESGVNSAIGRHQSAWPYMSLLIPIALALYAMDTVGTPVENAAMVVCVRAAMRARNLDMAHLYSAAVNVGGSMATRSPHPGKPEAAR